MPVKTGPDTTSTVTLPDATGPVIVPTTILTVQDAELLRDYKIFLEARGLTEALYCPDCFSAAADGVKILLKDQQIAVACPHRLLFYQGPIPPPTRFTAMAEAAAQHAILRAPGLWVAGNDPNDEPLFRTEASLLRAYRQFLVRYRVKEALTCNYCWGNGLADGTRTYVTADTIGIICRHRRLTYTGQTL